MGLPIRGWCNRQHYRFWPCHWGFESSPPSSFYEAKAQVEGQFIYFFFPGKMCLGGGKSGNTVASAFASHLAPVLDLNLAAARPQFDLTGERPLLPAVFFAPQLQAKRGLLLVPPLLRVLF